MKRFAVTRYSVMYLPVFLLILYQINTATGNQRCQAINGAHIYCHGFCCPGFGCCPYSSLWYVWLFLALFILMCMCSCASCGARRYRVIRNRRNNAPFLSYNEDALYRAERNKNCTNTQFNNLLCENGIPNRNYNTTPNIITTGTTTSREAKPIYPQEPPPAYATVIGPSAPPPPYSYH